MTNVFENTKQAINNFYKESIKLPSDPKQMAWNITMATYAQTGIFPQGQEGFREAFYRLYSKCSESLTSLTDYIRGLYEALNNPFQDKATEDYIEHTATQIQRLMKGFVQTFIPDDLVKVSLELALQCEALYKHFDEFRKAEEITKRKGYTHEQ